MLEVKGGCLYVLNSLLRIVLWKYSWAGTVLLRQQSAAVWGKCLKLKNYLGILRKKLQYQLCVCVCVLGHFLSFKSTAELWSHLISKAEGLALIIFQFSLNPESWFFFIYCLNLSPEIKTHEQFLDLELGIFHFFVIFSLTHFFSFLWVCAAKGNLDLPFGYFFSRTDKMPYYSIFFLLGAFHL